MRGSRAARMRGEAGSEVASRVRFRILVIGMVAAVLMSIGLPLATQASAASVVLRLGSRGAAVVTLQRDLHLRADGIFGRLTRAAVMTFQRRHHLVADGIVGARTWRALGGAPRAAKPAPRPAPKPRPVASGSALTARVLALAAAQRGKPYRWGAEGPHAFDCSGLVQYVYKRLGISVPRTTYQQYARLHHVSHAAVRPGDLIFTNRLGHVGIYAGFGVMWNAPHTGTVVQLSRVWDRRYVAARVG